MKISDKAAMAGNGTFRKSNERHAAAHTDAVMHFDSKIAEDGSLLTLTVGGYPDLNRFLTGLTTVAANPLWSVSTAVLCDFRELQASLLPAGRVMQAVMAIRHDRSKRYPNPVAVVVSSPTDCGTVRMWDVYTQEICPLRNYFYSYGEALEWLIRVQGRWLKGLTGIGDQGSGIRDRGSGTRDRGSGIGDQGSGIRDRGSGIGDQGSGIRDQGSVDSGARS